MKVVLEQISFWGAISGALMIAVNLPISGWAFIPFLMSNMSSLYLLRGTNVPRVIVYQLFVFLVINLVGVGRWLL